MSYNTFASAITKNRPKPTNAFSIGAAGDYLAILGLCAVYLLIPAELGVQPIYIADVPFRITFLVSCGIFVYLFLKTGGRVLPLFLRPYVIWQSVFCLVLLLSALFAENIRRSIGICLFYWSTFVLNFVILTCFFENGRRKAFVNTLCACGVFMALVAILEIIADYKLPFYLRLEEAATDFNNIGDFYLWNRANGTLGNSNIFGVAVVGIIPFALELTYKPVRWGTMVLLMAGASLTISRTIFCILFALAIGYLISIRHKIKGAILYNILIGITLLAVLLTSDSAYKYIVQPWNDRIGAGMDAPSRLNIAQRIDFFFGTFSSARRQDTSTIVLGHGLGSSEKFAEEFGVSTVGSATLDNTYATLFYDTGLLGLTVFLCLWAWLLFSLRRKFWTPYHYQAILGWLLVGFSFVQISYTTCNLPVVASLASIAIGQRALTRRRESLGDKTLSMSKSRTLPQG